ncbi:class I SAM-dependent methyltransferase [Sulfurimonas sp.]|uniref:class I SAM-dependent methyltransferase n=1 Tax=Sulfurimonas sp. TaxID=2022749 RepID=UPI002B46B162|nr:class I SAM-dependent methyltransferase [Sulfurimonas sp.]
MIKKVMDYISHKLIPILTGENKAPHIYISNMGYLNHKHLHNSFIKSLPYLNGICTDIGSGNAIYKKLILPHVDKYIAVDKSEIHRHMFQTSKEKFIDADIKNLPFDSNSIDSVILTQVLEHIDEPYKALCEVQRVLKKGGILILSVPFIYQAHATPYDFFRFSEYGLKELCKKYDFEILEFHYQGYFGTAIVSMLNGFIWNLASKYKILRNTIFLPILLIMFTINNIIGLCLDLIKLKEFTPNFFLVAKKL